MPKKSSKSKSKRLTLRQKHKILKKVKEHHRKKRKEERKKATTKSGKKEPFGKDPGIPSQWPFKEELIKEMAWKKTQILLEEKNKKDERKRARQGEPSSMDAEESDLSRLAALQDAAAKKLSEFETRKKIKGTGGVNADADKTRRAFYKEYKRVAEAADVIIQVLDARDPLACRCTDIEKHVRSINPNKRVLLLLNKIDLVPRDVVEKWLKYFREELPTVAFKCSTQEQATNISQKPSRGRGAAAGKKQNTGGGDAKAGAAMGSGCLGADTLLQLLKNYTRNAGIKTSITVGVVGLPNVGKSSLINSLKRTRVAQVGNTPGVTRSVQEVQLDKNIKLLDSPGVVFSNAESDAVAALRNAIKVESLPDPVTPVSEILKRVPAKQLMVVYKVAAFKDTDHFLQLIAAARGKLKKGGTPDCPAAARIVLQDWNSGRIPFYTLPPARADTRLDGAQVVQQWAKEFDVDEVFADEQRALVEHLPASSEAAGASGAVFFEAQSLGGVSMQLQDMEQEEEGGEGSDSEDAMDEGEVVAVTRKGAVTPGDQQGSLLYSEAGQYNPHAARAEKKRQKKLKAAGMPMDDDSDFDFEEANEEFGYKALNGTKAEAESEEDEEEEDGEDEDEDGEDEEEDEEEEDADGMEG